MLIKLTAVPIPEVDEGRSAPCYVQADRIVMFQRARLLMRKQDVVDERQRLADKLYAAAVDLWDRVGAYIPNMTDPVAVNWMTTARETAAKVTQAHEVWQRAWHALEANHPPLMCTEIQIACGATFQEGVMVSRVWVTETPGQIARMLDDQWRDERAVLSGLPK